MQTKTNTQKTRKITRISLLELMHLIEHYNFNVDYIDDIIDSGNNAYIVLEGKDIVNLKSVLQHQYHNVKLRELTRTYKYAPESKKIVLAVKTYRNHV